MNTTKFLNLTTAPTCESQTRIAKAIRIPLSLRLDFLFPPIPGRPRALLTVMAKVMCALPTQFFNISGHSSPHPCSWSSSDNLSVLCLTPSEGKQGKGSWDSVRNVHSGTQEGPGLHSHSHSLADPPEQLPGLRAPVILRSLYTCATFPLTLYFYCLFNG